MECYINFGTPGVIGGFLIIGGLLALADRRACQALAGGDIRSFTLWYLPGLSLLQVGGSLIEVTSTAAAAFVMAVLLNYLFERLPKPSTGQPAALALVSPQSRGAGR